MDLPENAFKRALCEGRPQIGLWQALASPYAAEICATMDFDWLLFDGEHAPNSVPALLAQLQAIAPYPVHPIARLPIGQTWIVKQYLDIGFTTILVPLIDTAEQAKEMVRAVRYPPQGARGVGNAISRAGRWNAIEGYLHKADAEICLLVQAETTTAIANLDAIAAVDGVDGIFIGPSDLSASMGHRGQPEHPEVQGEIERAIARIGAAGKAAGILTGNEAFARRYLELGCTFVAVGNDISLLRGAGASLLRKFKQGAPAPSSDRSIVY